MVVGLQSLPIPAGVREDLSLDFITGLSPSHGYTCILVVVDHYSKGAHYGALPQHHSTFKMATLFLDIVYKYHDFPCSLVSDRDPIFISSFWHKLFHLSGTKLQFSTAYHPKTDSQTKVINRIFEQYLHAFVHERLALWLNFLTLDEWSYNTSTHSSTLSPFKVMYGKPPLSIQPYLLGSSQVEAVDSLMTDRQAIHLQLQRRLLKAQANMKEYADAHYR